MAIIHRATITPAKAQLLERLLGEAVTVVGSYRFDDPEGEVGVEALLVGVRGAIRQFVFTYRASPRAGAEAHPVGTVQHSVLGTRWVYDGTRDPVALACFTRALRGEQGQAVEELWENGEYVGAREPTARLSLVSGPAPQRDVVPVLATDLEAVPRPTPRPHLRASWEGGEAVVARLP